MHVSGSLLHMQTEGLDGVRRTVVLIKIVAPYFEAPGNESTGVPDKIDLGVVLDKSHHVSLVKVGSAADVSGHLSLHDRVLEVDSVPLPPSCDPQEVQRMLRREPGRRLQLLVAKADFKPPSPQSDGANREHVEMVAAPALDDVCRSQVLKYRQYLAQARREVVSRQHSGT